MAAVAPIRIDSVHKHFGAVRALAEVSFALEVGDHTCLLGPNGAGKTTLIRLLSGALRPSAGTVSLFGAEVDSPAFLPAKRRVGIVPQSAGMYRDLSVRDYLSFVRDVYGRGDVDRAIADLDLGSFESRRMNELSGGTQRRLSIAAALLPDPELLLLDEPTAGLDPLVRREVHALLRRAMQGRTVLLCTHDLAEAEALCDQVVILRAGKLLVHSAIEALRGQLHNAVVLRAVEGPAPLHEALTSLGHPSEIVGDVVRVPVRAAEEIVPAMLQALFARQLRVYEARVVEPTLEDLFVQVVEAADARR